MKYKKMLIIFLLDFLLLYSCSNDDDLNGFERNYLDLGEVSYALSGRIDSINFEFNETNNYVEDYNDSFFSESTKEARIIRYSNDFQDKISLYIPLDDSYSYNGEGAEFSLLRNYFFSENNSILRIIVIGTLKLSNVYYDNGTGIFRGDFSYDEVDDDREYHLLGNFNVKLSRYN